MAWPDNECGPDPVKRNDRVEYHGYLPTSAEHKAEIDRRDEIIGRLSGALARIAHAHDEHGALLMDKEGDVWMAASVTLDWAQVIAKWALNEWGDAGEPPPSAATGTPFEQKLPSAEARKVKP